MSGVGECPNCFTEDCSVCSWISLADMENPESAHAVLAMQSASYTLWLLSGRQFGGEHRVTEVYCQTPYRAEDARGGTWRDVSMSSGTVSNHSCGGGDCPHELWLRGRPITGVERVAIGGNEIPLEDVAIVDSGRLAARRGACWGSCGAVEVTYTYGKCPPPSGKLAVMDLANRLVMAAEGDENCGLPSGVTQVTRQGVSYSMLQPADFLDRGRTGLYLSDLFLRSVNPGGARLRPRVFNPDVPRGRRIAPAPVISPPSDFQVITVPENEPLDWLIPGTYPKGPPPVLSAVLPGSATSVLIPDSYIYAAPHGYRLVIEREYQKVLPTGSELMVHLLTEEGALEYAGTWQIFWMGPSIGPKR